MELPTEVPEVRRIAMQPGDIIVVRYRGAISTNIQDLIKERLRSVFGTDHKIVILDQGMTLDIVAPVAAAGVEREVTR